MAAAEGREYRVGLVGCGQVAGDHHLPAVTSHPRTRLIAVADTEPARAAEYAARFGAAHYASHREMLARAALDLVIVATPPAVTPVIAADCLRAGAHVLCEKPIATDREAGRALVRAVEETGRLLQVGFIYRHSQAFQILRDWIRAGRIGSPMVVRLGNFDEPWMADVPAHNERIIGFLRNGSPLVMMGAHHADMLTMLVPARPVQAQGVAAQTRPGLPRANHYMGLLRFDDGSICKMEVGWLHPFPREERERFLYPTPKSDDIDFFGPRGVALYDYHGGRLSLLAEEGREERAVPPQELNFARQWASFVAAVDAGRTPEPSVHDGYRSLAVTLALQEAIEAGEIRDIPLD
jgi:myo-inositol 2-dehydrogenase / D-chiro-inositol 1-dehydrogenase